MENYLLLPYSAELEELSKQLGFSKTLFLGRELVLVKGNFKEVLNQCRLANGKKTIYFAENEEMLRLVVEKSPVDIVIGMEKIYSKDSLHYPKAGLNQVLGMRGAEKGKIFGFSFSEMLNSKQVSRLIHRMSFNLGVCKKHGVKAVFSNFSLSPLEMRSAADLEAVKRVLEKI
jgi:hypothetical protein